MHRHNRRPLFLCANLLLGAVAPAVALTINLTYVESGQDGSIPAEDPEGSRLMALANAAASYWETMIEDNHTLNLQVRYNNGISGIGKWDETAETNG